MQDLIALITAHRRDAVSLSRFTLFASGDPSGFWIVLGMRSERTLFNRVQVSSRLCTVRLDGSVSVASVVVFSSDLYMRQLIAASVRESELC